MRIGVDIGGTKIKAGLVENSRIYKRIEIETEANKGKKKVLQNIITSISSVYDKKAEGIGVGFAGVVNRRKGTIIISPHIKPLNGFNLKEFLHKKFKKKVIVDHDVNAAMLAEMKYGAGKGYKNAVMISIGTGIGGCITTDGKIYAASELGHMTIEKCGGKSTCCNNHGCFEEYVSTRALQRSFGRQLSPKEIEYRARKRDKKAIEAYNEMGRNIGIGIVNIANILNPEIIILGGGLSRGFSLFEKEMRKTVREREMIKTKIVKAKLDDAGIIGAAHL